MLTDKNQRRIPSLSRGETDENTEAGIVRRERDRAAPPGQTEGAACTRRNRAAKRPDVELEQLYTLTELFDGYYADRDRLSRALRLCGFSKRRIMRLFRERLHTTPGRYMCRVRLEKAKEKLRGGAGNVLDVALGCGFNSLSHFYEKFHEDTGMTPARYRQTFHRGSRRS